MIMKKELVFINQSIGPLFLELVEDTAGDTERLYLLTGTKLPRAIPHVRAVNVPPYDKATIFRRAWSWLSFGAVSAAKLLRSRRDVPILVVSNPPVLPWLAALVAALRKQPYIVIVYDIYPDLLVGLKLFGTGHPLIRLWRRFNRFAYNRANYVITLGPCMAGRLERYLDAKGRAERLKVIPTWVDCDRFVPLDKNSNEFSVAQRQQDKVTVMYSGNIGFSHDIRIMIEIAARLRDLPAFHFLIIGDGPQKQLLREKAASLKLDNVTFLPFQDERTLPLSLAAADVSVISIGSGVEGLMMPSKAYYAMAVGSALLGLSVEPNDLNDVIRRYECGVNVPPGDAEGAVAALEGFLRDRDSLLRCRRNARDAAVNNFSRKMNTGRVKALLGAL